MYCFDAVFDICTISQSRFAFRDGIATSNSITTSGNENSRNHGIPATPVRFLVKQPVSDLPNNADGVLKFNTDTAMIVPHGCSLSNNDTAKAFIRSDVEQKNG